VTTLFAVALLVKNHYHGRADLNSAENDRAPILRARRL
jgi:hypothetical protein